MESPRGDLASETLGVGRPNPWESKAVDPIEADEGRTHSEYSPPLFPECAHCIVNFSSMGLLHRTIFPVWGTYGNSPKPLGKLVNQANSKRQSIPQKAGLTVKVLLGRFLTGLVKRFPLPLGV